MVHPVGFNQTLPVSPTGETNEERATRIAREAKIIAKAEADIDAGLGIEDNDLEAWLDELDVDQDALMPTAAYHGPGSR